MLYTKFTKSNCTQLAVLIDPDRYQHDTLIQLLELAKNCKVDFLFVGGSLLVEHNFEDTLRTIKKHSSIPLILFPGSNYQVHSAADAILFLSLISGRNAEYLIGQHVVAAPLVKEAGLEVIPTGYILVDGGRVSTTSYITQTVPVPADKPEIAMATALAGEMLGLKMIYLEAGSGAKSPVSTAMIREVKNAISIPLIVGGGIRSAEQAEAISKAGADVVVVGNVLEKEPELLMEISLAIHEAKPAR